MTHWYIHYSSLLLQYYYYRLKEDPSHSLAPSYRTLFDNVDQTVDLQGYKNIYPLHLKTISIAGLPCEDVPCVEVWDSSGKIFSSHVGWKQTNMCTWNSEFGDGFFRVSQNILGDFAVICRFGGRLAHTKDKSTLIFKYQNNTGWLTNIKFIHQIHTVIPHIHAFIHLSLSFIHAFIHYIHICNISLS